MPQTLVTPKSRRAATPAAPALPKGPREVATDPDPVMVQAKRDIDAGLVDTDMRQTPGLDAARRKRLVPTPTVPSDGHAKSPSPPATDAPPRVR